MFPQTPSVHPKHNLDLFSRSCRAHSYDIKADIQTDARRDRTQHWLQQSVHISRTPCSLQMEKM